MTFSTVVFGSVSVANAAFNYTAGTTLTTARLLFIVPTVDTGSNPIGVGFVYMNQSGVQKTTSPANITDIPPYTPAGTVIQATLELGDTGILNIVSINKFVGGSTGDSLSFQSDALPPDIFGSLVVTSPGLTYTPGSSISTGGLRLFIVPTVNLGPAGIDIGFTYISQFGVLQTTTVTTAVSASTTSGSHIQVVLQPGDTGIQRLISINYFAGGTAGDSLSFESWNEGLGAPAFALTLTDPFDRTILGSYMPEMYLYEFPGLSFDTLSLIPDMYYSDPQIPVPMELSSTNMVAYLPEMMIDRGIPVREEPIIKTDGTLLWITEPTMRTFVGREFTLLKSWLESVVGQVISGYITNTQNQIIYNAIKLVLISSSTSTSQPAGVSDALPVDPDTGLYQAFIKGVTYDDRYVIIQAGVGKYTSLKGGGMPPVIDGTKTLVIPYNLQFDCPPVECDFDMTRKQ